MISILSTSLMGLGMPGPLAVLLGNSTDAVTAVGTAQGGSSPVIGAAGNSIAIATTGSGATAVTISDNVPVGQGVIVTNIAASIYAALVYPPTGGAINGAATNASATLAGGETAYFLRYSPTVWRAFGMPRLAPVPEAVTGVGTAQDGSSPLLYAGRSYLLTTAGGATAATIAVGMPIGTMMEVFNITATTGLLYPPTGCTIDQGASNASVSIAQNKGRIVRRTGATTFHTVLSA